MISTSGMLARELNKVEDSFITVLLDNDEYVIDSIAHVKDHFDSPSSHLTLKVRYGGNGNLKR